jgi:hypothetical protein
VGRGGEGRGRLSASPCAPFASTQRWASSAQGQVRFRKPFYLVTPPLHPLGIQVRGDTALGERLRMRGLGPFLPVSSP